MKSPWSLSPKETLGELDATRDRGLTHREARKRLKQFGPNRLRDTPPKSLFSILVSQIKNLIVLLLAVACGLAFVFGQALEGISIAVVLILNSAIGFFTELRAVRSMEALKKMTRTKSRVRRDGRIRTTPSENLVPGDLVAFEGGDLVGADLRLIEASRVLVDESALTGESMPVGKVTESLGEETPLAERKNMLFKGTALTGGSGEGIVVATGMQTEIGRISSLVEETEEELTSLEKRLNRLGYKLVWITLVTACLLGVGGIFSGMETLLIVETAIALAVAAIPEGLPIVATLALARGMWRMAERNALINRLSAVETLGSTGIICTDKTGTLTENRLTARRMIPASRPEEALEIDLQADAPAVLSDGEKIDTRKDPCFLKAVRIGVLCNNAGLADGSSVDSNHSVGDPLEIALLVLGAAFDVRREELLEDMPEVREDPFDPREARMATFHKQGEKFRVAVKGSPESVLEACRWFLTEDGTEELGEDTRERILKRNDEMAGDGLRNLALAEKTVGDEQDDPYEDLVFVGLVGFLDPPRHEVKDAIAVCRKAGIRTIMVTGDHPVTARNIAGSLGLVENDDTSVIHGSDFDISDALSEDARERYLRSNIFARIDPAQKLDLIDLHQKNGAVVAMTGDGVNDAPALKKADIGIAMGRRGTQVAREAADMILKDDSFNTVAVAVAQGRAIFDNIRKFILFLLSGNMGEIMIVGAALTAGERLPLLPLQILYLNMIGDVFPALALGLGREDDSIMERPPRKSTEPILPRSHWAAIAGYGALIAASVLGSYAVGLKYFAMEYETAVTVSFLTLAFARLLHTFNMRDRESRMLINEVTRNSYVWQALGLSTLLLLAAVFTDTLSDILRLTVPGVTGWMLIIAGSLMPLLVGQAVKGIRGRGQRPRIAETKPSN